MMKSLSNPPKPLHRETMEWQIETKSISRLNTLEWVSTLNIEKILLNRELPTLRNLRHLNMTAFENDLYLEYRAAMIAMFSQAVNFMRWSITWDADMVCEFIDYIFVEYPNWKPDDFALFIRYMKIGKFKSKYEHSIDYPTLCQWTVEYQNMWMDCVGNEGAAKKAPEIKPEKQLAAPKVSQQEVEEAKEIYNQMLDRLANKGKEPIAPEYSEPEAMQHIKSADKAYRWAMQTYIDKLQIPLNSPLVLEAAKEEFQENNPKKDWINEFIFTNFGYKGQVK